MESKASIVCRAQAYFDEGYACSQSVLLAFSEYLELDIRTAKLISSTFGGGMGRLREKCGALTGGFMVIGIAMGNERPDDMKTKLDAYSKVRLLNQHMNEIYGTTNCKELLRQYATQEQVEERKHHKILCRKLVGEATGEVFDLIIAGGNSQ
jgi:C_GCAxxG_C_C family probable redox protein